MREDEMWINIMKNLSDEQVILASKNAEVKPVARAAAKKEIRNRELVEGVIDSLKRTAKKLKRGAQGWGNQGMKNMTDKETPRDLVNRNKGYDDEKIKSLSKFRKAVDKERPATAHSPQALQNRVLDREIKKRGLSEGFSPYKPNTKVTIIGGPKDVIGKEGVIGEVKTSNGKKFFVVDYDHDHKSNKPNFGAKSVELEPKHLKLSKAVKEEKQEEQLEVINKAHADNGTAKKVFFTGSREECYEFMRSHKSLKMDLMYKDSGRLASYKL
jgi:hypothetical protein